MFKKVAAIYDLHGNLPALEAVIKDIYQEKVDCIIMGGDIVPGPMPYETLSYLLSCDIPIEFIQGNGEVDALLEMRGIGASRVPKQFREVVKWSAKQLQPKYEEVLSSWKKTLQVSIEGLGEVLFCHATPRDDNEIFTRLTLEDKLLPIFSKLNVDVVVCGHTHMQFDRMIGKVRVVNAGSVGMPFGKQGADWLILESDIKFCHTIYNLDEAIDRILSTEYPQVKEFVNSYIKEPPSEELMLKLFS